MTMTNNRFVNSTLPKPQEGNYNPIFNYEDLPLLPLEDALRNIIQLFPGVASNLKIAQEKCNRDSVFLTHDETAAIYLYTMPTTFFSNLNTALRSGIRHILQPWLTFLKLFITALKKLPTTKAVIWRGVNYDATLALVQNKVYPWWDINSCSTSISVVQKYLHEGGTLFTIEAIDGKDISSFSAVPDEQEVILMPGTRVRVKSQSLDSIGRLFVVHLEEIGLQK